MIESSNLFPKNILKNIGAIKLPIVAMIIKKIPKIKDSVRLYEIRNFLLFAFVVRITVYIEYDISENTFESFEASEKDPKSTSVRSNAKI